VEVLTWDLKVFLRSTLPSSSINLIIFLVTLRLEQTSPLRVQETVPSHGSVEENVVFGQIAVSRRFSRLRNRMRSEGAGVVACASVMPIAVLALAVGADYAHVSQFKSGVQRAADAASLAVAEAVARQPDPNDGGTLAGQVADVVFMHQAPHGAGTPNVDVKSNAAPVTATVGYAGLAPSNFGSAFGYDAVNADASSISPARVADFRSPGAR
jgi:Flp pilus assembly protein TadG